MITVETVMSARPCVDYTRERVETLFAGRAELSPREVAELEIPSDDKFWVLVYVAMDDRQRREFACDCASRALNRELDAGREPDARSWAAVEVARRFARGLATRDELAAARAAAWAAWCAARASDRDAAWGSAWAADRDSAFDAAWAAARGSAIYAVIDASRHVSLEWQLTRAVEILEGAE